MLTMIQGAMSELELLPPSELRPFLAFASQKRVTLLRAAGNDGSSPLTGRKHVVMRADHLAGHTLLAAPFGHYTYARTQDVTRATCMSQVPVRVRLYSLLPLLHLTSPRYEKPFWFYALKALDQFCANLGANGEHRTVLVSYLFDGKVVATAGVRRVNRYDVKLSNVTLTVDPDIHPKDHPAYAFDKAAASMLGGAKSRFGEDVEPLALSDLERLAKLGDLQSSTALALVEVHKSGKNLPADALIYDLAIAQDIDAARMRSVSDDGSAVASYLLAMDLSKSEKLFADHIQKGRDFGNLAAQKQQDFVNWYAKAKVGDVFWHRFLDPVVKRWSIPVAPVVAAVKRSGLRGTPHAQSDLAESAKEISKGRARTALNTALVRNSCSGWDIVTRRGRIATAAATQWKTVGEWCVMTTRVPGFTIRRMERVGNVETLDCKGTTSRKSCRLAFKVDCRAEETSQGVLPPAGVMAAICRGIESVTAVADAEFARSDAAGWHVVGSVKFLHPDFSRLKLETYKACSQNKGSPATIRRMFRRYQECRP